MKIFIKSLRNPLCISFIVLVILSGLLLSVYYVRLNDKWIVYKDTKYNFSFEYPRGSNAYCMNYYPVGYGERCQVSRQSIDDPFFSQTVYVRQNPIDQSSAREYVLTTYKDKVYGDPVSVEVNNLSGVRAYLNDRPYEFSPKVVYIFALDRGTVLEIPHIQNGIDDVQSWIDFEKFVSTIKSPYHSNI